MAFEVLEVFIIVEGMVANCIVLLGGSVYYRGVLVREAGQIYTVFLGI